MKLLDETGHRYGKLLVLGLGARRSGQKRHWRVECDCGSAFEITGIRLRSRGVVSCGCHRNFGRLVPHRLARTCRKCGRVFTVAAAEVAKGGGKLCSFACRKGDAPQRRSNPAPRNPVDRFWFYVDKNGPIPAHVPGLGPCWIFAKLKPSRYGSFCAGGVRHIAHRFSYELHYGAMSAANWLVCHKCDNRSCVRADHLFLGTPKDNTQDMIRKGRDNLKRDGVGMRNNRAKLTDDQVREIRAASSRGVSRNALARKYGVGKPMIKNIALRRNWKHVA